MFCRPASWMCRWLLVSLATQVALAEVPDSIRPPARLAAVVDDLEAILADQVAEKQLPALSVALIEQDRIVWARGFGSARSGQPATAATIYRVGSVSKLLTDLAIMRRVESGDLDLDAPVTRYLPEFQPSNDSGTPITLRQLMSHRSGVVREPPVGHYFDPEEPSLRDMVLSLNQTSVVYSPGTRTKYSNAGVSVAGYLLEKLDDRPFADIIQEQILSKIAASDSGFQLTDAMRSQLPDGQMWTYDGRRFAAPTFPLGTSPAGNLYSNVIDLGRFVVTLLREGKSGRDQLVQPATLRAMFAPQFAEDASFGLGFQLGELDGHLKIGHGGAVYGFSTQLAALPDQQIGVVLAASRDVSNGVLRRLADYSLRCLMAHRQGKQPPTFERTGPVTAERARLAAGLYADATGKRVRIRKRNQRLYLWRGSTRVELRAAGDELVADDVLGFGPRLKLSGDRLTIGSTVYQRQPDRCPPPMPNRWRDLVGEYGWDHNELFVFERHGQLHCLIEWIYYYPLKELGPNTFAFPDYGLYHGEKMIFQRADRKGRATSVVAADVQFFRREHGLVEGETFKITPIKSIGEIRATAKSATPPHDDRPRASDLVELVGLDRRLHLDIRYATRNNFMGSVFYQQPRAFMQQPAAAALTRAHEYLRSRGYGLLIHDAYRPWYVTKMFWDATPADMKIFVANPANGSRHNRGCAVDLTLCHQDTGEPIFMGAGYDEFSTRSFPDYEVANSRQRWHRELLRSAMEDAGFTIYEYEWWHFDHRDWKLYPLGNATFDQLLEN